MPVENISSVIANGILSYDAAIALPHASAAMNEVQTRRDAIIIPGTHSRLHSFANLYFTNNNPMMYKRKDQADSLCLLAVDYRVMDIPGVIVTDQNAAARLVRFMDPEEGLRAIDFEKVFAQYWVHKDEYETYQHKRIKCAEILVPHDVPYQYILGAFVVNESVRKRMIEAGFKKRIYVRSDKFYR